MRCISSSYRSFRLVFILVLGLGCGGGGDASQPASAGGDQTPAEATGSSDGASGSEEGTAVEGGQVTPEGSAEGGDASAEGGDATGDGGDASAEGGDASGDGAAASAEGGDASGDGATASAEGGKEGNGKESACGRLSRALEAVVTSEDPVATASEGGILVGENQVRVTVEMQADVDLPDLGDGVTVELQSGKRAQLLVPLDRLCELGSTAGLKSIRSPNKPSTKKEE